MSPSDKSHSPEKGEINWTRYVTVIAVVLLGIGYLALANSANTASPFVIARGESMLPTYRQGDLLLINRVAPATLEAGDVIVFSPTDTAAESRLPNLIAHRITSVGARDGRYLFETRGDNSDPDPFSVSSTQVRGQVVKNLGPIGRIGLIRINWFGVIFFIVPAAIVASIGWTLVSSQKTAAGKDDAVEVPIGQ